MCVKESIKLQKGKSILTHQIPNQTTQPEDYAHQMLFIFFPFRNESDLKAAVSGTYLEKLLEPSVTETVHKNRRACEPFADAMDEAFINFIANCSFCRHFFDSMWGFLSITINSTKTCLRQVR